MTHKTPVILRIHPEINPSSGGTYTSIVENTRYLTSKGVLTIMLTPGIPPSTPEDDICWGRTYYFRSFLGPFSFSFDLYQQAQEIIQLYNVDIIIIDGLWQYCGVVASKLYRNTNVSVIQYTHGMLDPFYATQKLKFIRNKIYWSLVERKNMKARSSIIFTHITEKTIVDSWCSSSKASSYIQPLGISGSPIHSEKYHQAFTKQAPCKLLFFGRIHPKKGIDILIKAISLLAKPELVELLIVGPDGPSTYKVNLLRLIDKYNLQSIITWESPVYGSEKWDYYRDSDAFILSTRGENFGLTIPEALSSCTPVISTNKAAIHEFISDYEAGIVSEANPDSVASAIDYFLSITVEKRKLMSSQARLLFDQVFSSKVANEKLYSLLSDKD